MRYRKGIFFVVYKKEEEIKYLLLKRSLHWEGWEFPKAGLEEGEIGREAVKRELKEETGLDAKRIEKFNKSGKFDYDRELEDRPGIIGQTWVLYGVEVKDREIKLDKDEHSDYKWLNFKEGLELLKWPNQKECLKLVNKKIK
jgi:dATP pyrophosphohydrolase